jgi:hypothetical protein
VAVPGDGHEDIGAKKKQNSFHGVKSYHEVDSAIAAGTAQNYWSLNLSHNAHRWRDSQFRG